VQKLLLSFYVNTKKKKPERLIFFRDGVSEGQIQHCLARELPQIKQACRVGMNSQILLVTSSEAFRTFVETDGFCSLCH
jgi:hypothetical protein